MPERSIHDNIIYAYSVLCEQRRLVLHTEYRSESVKEYTDVVFKGVVAHYFETVVQRNILFDVSEVSPEKIVREWADLFARQKAYRWPEIEYSDPQQLIAILRSRSIKAFEVGSSYGLSGWVLASSAELVPREAKRGDEI